MPDISKCSGEGCPFKETSYRYLVPSSEFRQSWFSEPLYKDGECDYYWRR